MRKRVQISVEVVVNTSVPCTAVFVIDGARKFATRTT